LATKDGEKKEGETVSCCDSREIRGSQCDWDSTRDSTGRIVQAETGETQADIRQTVAQ
jgi:hypothetical protein